MVSQSQVSCIVVLLAAVEHDTTEREVIRPVTDHASCSAAYSIAILMKVPLSKEKQQYLSQTAAELGKTQNGSDQKESPFPPSHYILRPDMMVKMGYPLRQKGEDGTLELPDGFVSTTSRGVLRGGFNRAFCQACHFTEWCLES